MGDIEIVLGNLKNHTTLKGHQGVEGSGGLVIHQARLIGILLLMPHGNKRLWMLSLALVVIVS